MKSLTKFWSLGFLLMLAVSSGCMTWKAKIEDMSGIYNEPTIVGAPGILITDLLDKRSDKKLVGRISALNLATETPINIIITNRIASKLRESGFNVQKFKPRGMGRMPEFIAALRKYKGKMLLTGRLDHFYIESSDAVLETARGQVSFRINILDEGGRTLFYKVYTGNAEKHIGLGGGPGSEELIEKTVQAAVNELFKDIEFRQFLLKVKNI